MKMTEEKHNLEDHADDAEEGDQGELPVVLQCSHCNMILGDSMSWVSTNDELNSITLRSVSSMVVKGKELVTSTEGIDLGSTYQQLQCKSCKDVVGRMYRTTPRTLDDLRDLFTLYITKINSYQIGSSEQTAGVGNSLIDLPTAREIQTSITKTQVMVCTLNERVLNIEKAMEIEYEDENETDLKPENDTDKVLQVSAGKRDGLTDQNGTGKRDGLTDKYDTGKRDGLANKNGTKNSMGRMTGKQKQLKEINHNDEEEEEESESEEEEEEEIAVKKNKRGRKKNENKNERLSKRSRIK
ncbi:protein Mis18-alpha-like [Amphiura filiformis]|uniref:protein Mis18-alpha-like n=1 Tax=Amphiura filiformis TaxID=82378 RepID=UPI003B21DE0F